MPLSQRVRTTPRVSAHNSSSVLTISKASYLDTGYYSCYREGDTNKTIVHRQFLFVEGTLPNTNVRQPNKMMTFQ